MTDQVSERCTDMGISRAPSQPEGEKLGGANFLSGLKAEGDFLTRAKKNFELQEVKGATPSLSPPPLRNL